MKPETLAVALLVCLFAAPLAVAQDLEDQARGIARELQCPVCQGLSVADSPAPLATQMRELIRARLEAGDSRQQILDYFSERYGDSVLLSPPKTGFTAVAWAAPYFGLAAGIAFLIWAIRRRPPAQSGSPTGTPTPDNLAQYLTEVDLSVERLKDQPLR